MKVKYETHHGRVKMAKTKEYPTTTARCPFGDMRPPFLKLMFYNVGGSTSSISVGQNILTGKIGREAPEFIFGNTRILARNLIV